MTDRNWKKNTGEMPVDGDQMVVVCLKNDPDSERTHVGPADGWAWGECGDGTITFWDYEPPRPVDIPAPNPHDRVSILDTAKEYITKDRAVTHGQDAENSFGVIADFWSAYLGMDLDAEDVCAMMALLKLARIKNNPAHTDSWIDVAGYAALGGEIATAKPLRG